MSIDEKKVEPKKKRGQRVLKKAGPDKLVPVTDTDGSTNARAMVVIQSVEDGTTLTKACAAAGLSPGGFYLELGRCPEAKKAYEIAKITPVCAVVDALYQSAVGYVTKEVAIVEEAIYDLEGREVGKKVKTTKTQKTMPPSAASIQFYLKNRDKGKWMADQHIKLDTSHTERTEIEMEIGVREAMKKLTVEELELLDEFNTAIEARVISRDDDEAT